MFWLSHSTFSSLLAFSGLCSWNDTYFIFKGQIYPKLQNTNVMKWTVDHSSSTVIQWHWTEAGWKLWCPQCWISYFNISFQSVFLEVLNTSDFTSVSRLQPWWQVSDFGLTEKMWGPQRWSRTSTGRVVSQPTLSYPSDGNSPRSKDLRSHLLLSVLIQANQNTVSSQNHQNCLLSSDRGGWWFRGSGGASGTDFLFWVQHFSWSL